MADGTDAKLLFLTVHVKPGHIIHVNYVLYKYHTFCVRYATAMYHVNVSLTRYLSLKCALMVRVTLK
jgi:hypothetical protein